MSELKATTVYDAYWKANSTGEGTGILIYLKSEADKEIQRLEKLCENYRCDCDNLAIMINTKRNAARTLRQKMNHQKYKRCLDKAKMCESEENRLEAISPIFDTDKEYWEYNSDYWAKWHDCWLKLAEKFKPNN